MRNRFSTFFIATLIASSITGCAELGRFTANLGLGGALTRPDPNEELAPRGRKQTIVKCCACTDAKDGHAAVWPYTGADKCEYLGTGFRFKSCTRIDSVDRTCSLAQLEQGDWRKAPVCNPRAISHQLADESLDKISPGKIDCEFETAPYAAPVGGLEEETFARVPGVAPLSVCACTGKGGVCTLVRWDGPSQTAVRTAKVDGTDCDFETCRAAFPEEMRAFCPLFNPAVAKRYADS